MPITVTNNSATIIDRFAFVVQTIKGEPTKPDVTSTLAMAVQGSGIDDAAAVAFSTTRSSMPQRLPRG